MGWCKTVLFNLCPLVHVRAKCSFMTFVFESISWLWKCVWHKNPSFRTISNLASLYAVADHFQQGSSGSHKSSFNTLRPRQNGQYFADDILKCILLNENLWIWKKISLKYVPYGLIGNMTALVQIMAWCHTGDKSLSEAMLVCCTEAHTVYP